MSDEIWYRYQAMVERGNREPTVADLEFLLDGIDDTRFTYDPFDPPGFDWGGGAAVAGNGTEYRISEAAVAALRKTGGDPLWSLLASRLGGDSADVRRRAARHAVAVYDGTDVLVELVRDPRPGVRQAILAALPTFANLPNLANALVDDDDDVVERLVAWVRGAIARKQQRSLTNVDVERAAAQVSRASIVTRPTRVIALALVGWLGGAWPQLARACAELSNEELERVVDVMLTERLAIEQLGAADPALRARIKAVTFAKLQRSPAELRETATRALAAFAPDRDAFALVLGEVRQRMSLVAARWFVEREASLLGEVIAAIFECSARDSFAALEVGRFVGATEDAFARALAAEPERLEQRRQVLQELLATMRGGTRDHWVFKIFIDKLEGQARNRS